jgi:hypothetical protein
MYFSKPTSTKSIFYKIIFLKPQPQYQTPKSVFGSVVAGAFQIIFHAKMYVNDFFYFLKIIFDISTSKRSKTYKSY